MKKFLICILSLVLLMASALGGCSCTSSPPLAFTECFHELGDVVLPTGWREVCEYEVKYVDNYENEFAKSPMLPNSKIKIEMQGTYVTNFQVVDHLPDKSDFLENKIRSDIPRTMADTDKFYKLVTTFSIPEPKYFVKGSQTPVENVSEDKVESVVYFLSGKNSFKPIYAETKSSYSAVFATESTVTIGRFDNETYTVYNNETYTTTAKSNKVTLVNGVARKYDVGSAIDNTQLLFCARNVNPSVGSAEYMPVITYQYEKPQRISVLCQSTSSATIADGALTFNGVNFDDQDQTAGNRLKLKRYEIGKSEATETGIHQLAFIQNGKCGNLGKRNLLYRYVQPITEFNSFLLLGAMQYTLKTVTVS